MKNLLTLLLISLAIAGCSPTPRSDAGPASAAATSTAGSEVPPDTGEGGDAALNPDVTAAPPGFPIAPPGSTGIPLLTEGWQTYTSTRLAVSVDYPPDWSAAEQGDGVVFAAVEGATVLLEPVQANDSGAGQDCVTLVNSYGQTVDLCLDSASRQYSATFSLTLTGSTAQVLRLSTLGDQALDVYKLMVNSLRPAQ